MFISKVVTLYDLVVRTLSVGLGILNFRRVYLSLTEISVINRSSYFVFTYIFPLLGKVVSRLTLVLLAWIISRRRHNRKRYKVYIETE